MSDDGLSIDEMLSDPLFQLAVAGITEQTLSDLLLETVSVLEAGQLGRAGPLLSRLSAEADALLDDPSADASALVLWSVVERYLEEAELF